MFPANEQRIVIVIDTLDHVCRNKETANVEAITVHLNIGLYDNQRTSLDLSQFHLKCHSKILLTLTK